MLRNCCWHKLVTACRPAYTGKYTIKSILATSNKMGLSVFLEWIMHFIFHAVNVFGILHIGTTTFLCDVKEKSRCYYFFYFYTPILVTHMFLENK